MRPTLFTDVTNDMRIAREEIFGPVLSVLTYRDEDDAVRIANDSDYGLAGSVWTADIAHGLEVAASVRAGTYGINMYTLDIGSPFGGFKQSGIGREFGPEGLDEYVELQSVVQRKDATAMQSASTRTDRGQAAREALLARLLRRLPEQDPGTYLTRCGLPIRW